MLVSRSIRSLATQCRPASMYTWSLKTRTIPAAHQTATTWYVKTPTMTAAYSTNPKKVSNSLLLMQKRMDSTAAPKPKIITSSNLEHESKTISPLTTNISIGAPSSMPPPPPPPSPSPSIVHSQSIPDKPPTKQTKSPEPQAKSNIPMPPSKPSLSDTRLQPPNIKMPSREQLEKYFFTALVYVWDFCYYILCLTLRLTDTYILKNPTLQENWKKLMKRLDEQRQSIKSKK